MRQVSIFKQFTTVIAERTVEEVIEDGKNGWLVDFFDNAAMSDRIADALAQRDQVDELRHAARQTVIDRYDLTSCMAAQRALIDAAFARG